MLQLAKLRRQFNCLPEATKYVNVVFEPTDDLCRAVEVFTDTGAIGVSAAAEFHIIQKRLAFFCREDDV